MEYRTAFNILAPFRPERKSRLISDICLSADSCDRVRVEKASRQQCPKTLYILSARRETIVILLLFDIMRCVLLNPDSFGRAAHYLIVLDLIKDGDRQAGADHGKNDPFRPPVQDLTKQPGKGDGHDYRINGCIELQPDLTCTVEKDVLWGRDQADQRIYRHDDLHGAGDLYRVVQPESDQLIGKNGREYD